MSRKTVGVLASAMAFIAISPATALADRSDCRKSVENSYSAHYYAVAKKMGKRAPGRNIRRQGLSESRRASCRHLQRSLRTFQRWLAPPPAPVVVGDISSAHAPPHRAGGGYSIPRSIVMCESGGNYNAVNASSGARGAYQILPSTHASVCPGLGWSPPDQDRCAAKVWAVQGRGAWVC